MPFWWVHFRLAKPTRLQEEICEKFEEDNFGSMQFENVNFSGDTFFNKCNFHNCEFFECIFSFDVFEETSFIECRFHNCEVLGESNNRKAVYIFDCKSYGNRFIEDFNCFKSKNKTTNKENECDYVLMILEKFFKSDKKSTKRREFSSFSSLLNQDSQTILDTLSQLKKKNFIKQRGSDLLITSTGISHYQSEKVKHE